MAYNADNHYGFIFKEDKYVRRRFQQYLSLIRDDIKSEVSILDVGGYMGDLYEFMKIRKIDVSKVAYSIVDYDDSAMEVAKSRGVDTYKIDFNFQSIEEVIGDKKFDIIICTEVLEHLLDPAKHIGSFSKLLKEGGKCIISLPNENTIFHRLYALFGMGIDHCVFELYKHLHFPTIKQSRTFVSKFMKLEKERYYINFGGVGSKMNWAGKLLRLLPDSIWQKIANIFPGLFARGIIFELKNK